VADLKSLIAELSHIESSSKAGFWIADFGYKLRGRLPEILSALSELEQLQESDADSPAVRMLKENAELRAQVERAKESLRHAIDCGDTWSCSVCTGALEELENS
jgi:hypothetical protein